MKAAIITILVIIGFAPLLFAVIQYRKHMCRINWFKYENKKKQKSFLKENKTAPQGQIVFIGDSIIDLYDIKKHLQGYKLNIYNRGISGDTTTNMLSRLESNALAIKPSSLFVLIGTNDIDKNITRETTLANIESIIKMAKDSLVEHIFIESVYPVNANVDKAMVSIRDNDFINALNQDIEKICNDNDVTYINIHDSLLDDKGLFKKSLTIDGLHPNSNGYEIVTDIVKKYIIDNN